MLKKSSVDETVLATKKFWLVENNKISTQLIAIHTARLVTEMNPLKSEMVKKSVKKV